MVIHRVKALHDQDIAPQLLNTELTDCRILSLCQNRTVLHHVTRSLAQGLAPANLAAQQFTIPRNSNTKEKSRRRWPCSPDRVAIFVLSHVRMCPWSSAHGRKMPDILGINEVAGIDSYAMPVVLGLYWVSMLAIGLFFYVIDGVILRRYHYLLSRQNGQIGGINWLKICSEFLRRKPGTSANG